MEQKELQAWFVSLRKELEEAYLQHDEPWKQSGFSGPEDRWVKCRKPIADCVEEPGSFLDIGCANGYLLECMLKWTAERGLAIVPFGLDLSAKLIELARQRLPKYRENLHVANAWEWDSPMRFDYVRTEVSYVPEPLQRQYVQRIVEAYLTDSGRALVTEYRSRRDSTTKPWIDRALGDWEFTIAGQASGCWDGKELTRVVVITK